MITKKNVIFRIEPPSIISLFYLSLRIASKVNLYIRKNFMKYNKKVSNLIYVRTLNSKCGIV